MSGNNETTKEMRKKYLPLIQYRVDELPCLLGVGKTKINEWIKSRKLKSYKIDSTVFVHAEDVANFVEKHRQPAFDYEIQGGSNA
jgi:excisionase family DNA binding protein